MVTLLSQRFIQAIVSCLIVIFFLVGARGLPHFAMIAPIGMDSPMVMSDCMMPGMTTICHMNLLEHIASWQSMFASLPVENPAFALLLFILVVAVGRVWTRQQYPPQYVAMTRVRSPHEHEYIPPATSLQELFSSGILHAKIFAYVRLTIY